MHNEFAKCEIKTSVFSGRKSQAGNYCGVGEWAALFPPDLLGLREQDLSPDCTTTASVALSTACSRGSDPP